MIKKILERMYLIGFVWLLVLLPTYRYWKGIYLMKIIFFVGMIAILAGIFLEEKKIKKELMEVKMKERIVIQSSVLNIIHLVDKEKDIEKLRELAYSLIDHITAETSILIKKRIKGGK